MIRVFTPKVRLLCALVGVALLGACATPDVGSQIDDPYEVTNRAVHAENLLLDQQLVRPVSNAYGTSVPGPMQKGIANVASNLSTPSDVLNNLLQVRLGQAAQNTSRFLVNSTVGVFGLFDVASAMGIPAAPTDFGETLYYWRVPEGSYAVLPVVGPSTSRHAVGRLVDLALNPIRSAVPAPESTIGTVFGVADAFGTRYRNAELIDSVLYESADSYAQARLLYLQNRRFQLRGSEVDDDYFDPYEDPYADFN
ncbi:VacJ family lipoprotein [Thalassobacter stenotrophicus]|uniref:MlaA family lipoprotein n=1 Tax=Thalassobacter stenotrophicus TaxID=266809 RepID=UPI0022A90C59|nr:VacJ family lipoprotein [Thalassobacter stenotrophicus]UYP67976.1 VacJ family lipoprotein [Thalassobacter stenotrophicus]